MDDDANDQQPEQRPVLRNERGHFLPGHAPKGGRPRGLTHSEKLRALLEPERETLVGRLLEATQSTDTHARVAALRVAFEYLGPKPKQEPERVSIPGISEAATMADKARCVLAAVASGEATPESGEKLLRMLDLVAKAVKMDEIERRLQAIESGRPAPSTVIDVEPGSDLA